MPGQGACMVFYKVWLYWTRSPSLFDDPGMHAFHYERYPQNAVFLRRGSTAGLPTGLLLLVELFQLRTTPQIMRKRRPLPRCRSSLQKGASSRVA